MTTRVAPKAPLEKPVRSLLWPFGALLLLLIGGGFALLGALLPEHVDASLRGAFTQTLEPRLGAGLSAFNEALLEELEQNRGAAEARLRRAFEATHRAKVKGLLKAIMPLVESFDEDGTDAHLKAAIEGEAALKAVAYRTEEGGALKRHGAAKLEGLVKFAHKEKAEFAYVELEIYVSPQALELALAAERASCARIGDNVSEAAGRIEAQLSADLTEIRGDLAGSVRRRVWRLAAGLCALVLLGSLLFLWWMVIAPLRGAQRQLLRVSGGDLTQKRPTRSRTELGAMTRAMNAMVDALGGIVERITRSASTLGESARFLDGWTEELAEGARAQAEEIDAVAVSMTQMSESISEVARRASKATDASEASLQLAEEGREAVAGTVARIEQIATSVSASTRALEALSGRNDEIAQIVGTINEIAEQTHLLALNATIEAARAGERGRGFAVVAEEVRKLATRTGEATQQIAETISSIQADTGASLEAMRAGGQTVEAGVERAQAAQGAMEQIVLASRGGSEMIHHIAVAAEEQSAVACSVSESVAAIAHASERVKGTSEAIREATQELVALSAALRDAAAWFNAPASGG